jgi:hypothetical protein
MKKLAFISLALIPLISRAQVSQYPHAERFDSVAVPALPQGWLSSTNRVPSGDFVTTTSAPRSSPNCVLSTNAQISQILISPAFSFAGRTPDKLQFFTARSATHTAGLLAEASTDNGKTFPVSLTDTLRNPGTTSYVLTSLQLPTSLANQTSVRFRWRIVGSSSGGTGGTFRLDDVSLTVLTVFDIAATQLTISPNFPSPQDGVSLQASLKNFGTSSASGYTVDFFQDENDNRIADGSERFASVSGSFLVPADSTLVTAFHPPLGSGEFRFIAVATLSTDENRSNDTASVIVSISAGKRMLVVNEIMFDPLAGQNEWMELYNRSAVAVNLARWKFNDRPTSGGSVNSVTITTQSRLIQPGDFVVVAAESTILSLFPYLKSPASNQHLLILNRSSGLSFNNDGDDVVLLDAAGQMIDSVSYSASWHNPDMTDTKGRSLERINPSLDSNDPRNWSTSAVLTGGTPDLPNSVFTIARPSAASLSASPNPFSPDGDGFQDFCSIRYNLPTVTSIIGIKIFDIRGRLIRTLANANLGGAQGEIIWDGLDDDRQRVRIGPYVLYLEAADSRGGTVATAKAVVVVARKL